MTPTPESSPAPRLLVVTIDRLPAWMLSAWGATWVATPAIDALAARGLVFDRLITPAIDPVATLRDLVGPLLDTSATGARRPAAVVTDDPAIVAAVGGDAAADVRHVAIQPTETVAEDESRTNLARLFAAAVEAVGEPAGEAVGESSRRVVWCHASSLGVVWDAPQSFRDAYVDPEDPVPPFGARPPEFRVDAETDPDLVVGVRQVFAGQLTLLDRQFRRLLDAIGGLDGRGDGGREGGGWTVLMAGVRGLPLGLHGWVGGGGDAVPYGETIHVPAVLADARGRSCGQRYGGLVVPADLGATLRDLLAGDGPAAMGARTQEADDPRGRSLVPLLETWALPPRGRVVATGERGVAVVTPEWQLLLERDGSAAGPRPRLFAKPDDHFELSDVADRCPEVVEGLR